MGLELPQHGQNDRLIAQTFMTMRAFQFAIVIVLVGLTSNFVAIIINGQAGTPSLFFAPFIINIFAALYLLISVLFWCAKTVGGLKYFAIADVCIMAAYIAISVVLCIKLDPDQSCGLIGDMSQASRTTQAADLSATLANPSLTAGEALSEWIYNNHSLCWQLKFEWIFSIVLSIFFCLTPILLWYQMVQHRKGGGKHSRA